MQWMFPFHCDEFSLQGFFSLRWIHCFLAGVVTIVVTKARKRTNIVARFLALVTMMVTKVDHGN